MKKLFLGILFFAAVVVLTSCEDEELKPNANNDKTKIEISADENGEPDIQAVEKDKVTIPPNG